MKDGIRWGILGPGSIANQFAKGLQAVAGARLMAVGSRDAGRAATFADQYQVPHRHGSYAALAADPDVDAIYVASPHTGHAEHTQLCLSHGKAVLCEKPFAVNAVQARRMIETARETRTFLMEAMWTRFLPAMTQVRRWLAEGLIGEPRLVTADFGFRAGLHPEGRLLNPALAGGSLLDVGIYTLSLAQMVFQDTPVDVKGVADIGSTGVDEQAAMVLRYPRGRLALLSSAVRTNTIQEARIEGTEGRMVIPQFWHASEVVVTLAGKDPQRHALPFTGTGYNYEAEEVGHCLHAGKRESAVMPLAETLSLMETMDGLRQQWGLTYPCEVPAV
ncbi:MAG: Gfo/Idh/MocA family oxidoreductase [Lentisphaerae bacterium]|nr:Gfo/Idh/MocA family oxidoreductase [Lentisphaerota bacterium]